MHLNHSLMALGLVFFSELVYCAVSADDQPQSITAITATIEFEAIDSDRKSLWASDECFKPPHSDTHDSIARCWSQRSTHYAAAKNATYLLLDRLGKISDVYPRKSRIVHEKINMMTRAALFCEQKEISTEELDFIKISSTDFSEWSYSLLLCARETSNTNVYIMLRGWLMKNIMNRSFSKSVRVTLLKLWFDSFTYEHSPKGDFSIVAAALNREGLEEWSEFMSMFLKVVPRFPYLSSATLNARQINLVKKALSAV